MCDKLARAWEQLRLLDIFHPAQMKMSLTIGLGPQGTRFLLSRQSETGTGVRTSKLASAGSQWIHQVL